MKKVTYDLDFYQAMRIVMEGGAVKGEQFADGIYMKLNSNGVLVIVDANNFYSSNVVVPIGGMDKQRFRELSIMTKKELSK